MMDHEKVNILLVDDQPAKLLAYEVILKELGENLAVATSGREALEYLLKNEVAVILVDVCMPDLDGFELAKWIHEHKPDIPVILASGYSGKTNMAAEMCGAEFLRKPFDFDNVVEKIRETIARKKPRRA